MNMEYKDIDVSDERVQFLKMLLSKSMSLEEKIDELWDLKNEELQILLKRFESNEDYEICQAIKAILDERK